MSPRARLAAGVLLATLSLAACGRKGPPAAPEARVPRAAGDLAVVVRASTIELSWTNPTRRVDGTRLRDLTLARVFRVDDAGGGEPKAAMQVDGRIAGYTEITAVSLDAPAPAFVAGHRVTGTDGRDPTYSRRYTYVVVPADPPRPTRPPSARVAVTPRKTTPPGPPENLVAIPSAATVRLSWSPSPDSDVAGYVVYRAAAEGPFVRVGSTRAPTTAFVDRDVPRGTYRYAVTAQDRASLPNQSRHSNEVTVSVP